MLKHESDRIIKYLGLIQVNGDRCIQEMTAMVTMEKPGFLDKNCIL